MSLHNLGGCSYQYPMEHLTCFHGYLLVFGFHSKFPKLLALDNESGASDFTVIGLSAFRKWKSFQVVWYLTSYKLVGNGCESKNSSIVITFMFWRFRRDITHWQVGLWVLFARNHTCCCFAGDSVLWTLGLWFLYASSITWSILEGQSELWSAGF